MNSTLTSIFKSDNTFVAIKVMWALTEFITTMCMGKWVSMLTNQTHYITILALIYSSTTILVSKVFKLQINERGNRWMIGVIVLLWSSYALYIRELSMWAPYLLIVVMAIADLSFRPWISLLIDKMEHHQTKVKILAKGSTNVGIFGAITFLAGSYLLKGYDEIQIFLSVALILAIAVFSLLTIAHRVNVNTPKKKEETNTSFAKLPVQAVAFQMGMLFILYFLFQVLFKSADGINIFYVIDRIGENKEYQFKFMTMYFVGYTVAPMIFTRWVKPVHFKAMIISFFSIMIIYFAMMILKVPYLYVWMIIIGACNSMFGLYINSTMHKHFSEEGLKQTLNTFYRFSAMGPLVATITINSVGMDGSLIFVALVPVLISIGLISIGVAIKRKAY